MPRLLHAERYYYIDESGDSTLFDSRGNIIVGQEGASRVFIVGAAQIHNPRGLETDLQFLRQQLVGDPYFRGVPSLAERAKKTALYFHAKDDLPEVRRDVMRVLRDHPFSVVAAIRRKRVVAEFAKERFERTGRKITEHELYDDLVQRILRDRLHMAAHTHIWFARRGKRERKEALERAIDNARQQFALTNLAAVLARLGNRKPKTTIYSAQPSDVAGLQAIDYCLWALHRLLERGDDRFFNYLGGKFRLIWDVDDIRRKAAGEWHRAKRRRGIDGSKIMPVVS